MSALYWEEEAEEVFYLSRTPRQNDWLCARRQSLRRVCYTNTQLN